MTISDEIRAIKEKYTPKYQESLDNLVEYFNNRGIDRDCADEIQTSIDDLQELIDNYYKISTPRLLQCTCGHNRRHKIWDIDNKILTIKCDKCGREVKTRLEHRNQYRKAAIHWNEVVYKKVDESTN